VEVPRLDWLTTPSISGFAKQYDNLTDAGSELLERLQAENLHEDDLRRLEARFGRRCAKELRDLSHSLDLADDLHFWVNRLLNRNC
jgi:hypothetical protein